MYFTTQRSSSVGVMRTPAHTLCTQIWVHKNNSGSGRVSPFSGLQRDLRSHPALFYCSSPSNSKRNTTHKNSDPGCAAESAKTHMNPTRKKEVLAHQFKLNFRRTHSTKLLQRFFFWEGKSDSNREIQCILLKELEKLNWWIFSLPSPNVAFDPILSPKWNKKKIINH